MPRRPYPEMHDASPAAEGEEAGKRLREPGRRFHPRFRFPGGRRGARGEKGAVKA